MSKPVDPTTQLRLIAQRSKQADCTIATIATLTWSTYEDVLATAGSICGPHANQDGLTWQQMRKVCTVLGHTTRLQRWGTFDPELAVGILHVYRGKRANNTRESHVVLLWHGHVIDGGDELWESLDDFLRAYEWKAGSLLTLCSDPTPASSR